MFSIDLECSPTARRIGIGRDDQELSKLSGLCCGLLNGSLPVGNKACKAEL